MTIIRKFWLDRIMRAWQSVPIVWLSGVRRSGKTTIAKSIDGALYLNCDLPTVAERLSNPESFLSGLRHKIVIFDEVHRLTDPSKILKIAADEYPKLKVLATGSSTLGATEKFSDSLTGRKRTIHLTPVLLAESQLFNDVDLDTRLRRGGLPPRLLSKLDDDDEFYSEWIDSFYARDMKELFKIEKRRQFIKLFEMLLAGNGNLIDISKLATDSELSRPTVMNYMDALETGHAIHIIRPFHGGKTRELIKQPKVYGFDTGFIAHIRGWSSIPADVAGTLWENLVLDSLLANLPTHKVHFWRDDKKNEIDFVVVDSKQNPIAIECKLNGLRFEPKGLKLMRSAYVRGDNYVVEPYLRESYSKLYDGVKVDFVSLAELISRLAKQ